MLHIIILPIPITSHDDIIAVLHVNITNHIAH